GRRPSASVYAGERRREAQRDEPGRPDLLTRLSGCCGLPLGDRFGHLDGGDGRRSGGRAINGKGAGGALYGGPIGVVPSRVTVRSIGLPSASGREVRPPSWSSLGPGVGAGGFGPSPPRPPVSAGRVKSGVGIRPASGGTPPAGFRSMTAGPAVPER